MTERRAFHGIEDVFALLDEVFVAENRWQDFYADRSRDVPFFVDTPDETLVDYVRTGLLTPGRALDLGCGTGRNARFLAAQGWTVTAIDQSPSAISWAKDIAATTVEFRCANIFTTPLETYDLIYDSGCFHHLPPHRRYSYRQLLDATLTPGGHFALTCFASGREGSDAADVELYRSGSLHGGVAYEPEDLHRIFAPFEVIESRPMRAQPRDAETFGLDFLHSALYRRTN